MVEHKSLPLFQDLAVTVSRLDREWSLAHGGRNAVPESVMRKKAGVSLIAKKRPELWPGWGGGRSVQFEVGNESLGV